MLAKSVIIWIISYMAESLERSIHISGNEFEDYEEATEFLVDRVSESHLLSRLFTPQVVGGLVMQDGGHQTLRIVGEGVIGEVPRYMRGLTELGVTVSGYPGEQVDVVAHVENWESDMLDRGLVWVRIGPEVPPLFQVIIRPEHGVASSLEMANRLEVAEQKSIEFINGILRSEVIAPTARGYSAAA